MALRLPALLLLAACGAAAPPPVHLETGRRDGRAALIVVPTDGARLNAKLPPALEWQDGRVVRITSGEIAADGDYYTGSAWTERPPELPPEATLRVSFCRAGEGLCRTITIPVRLGPAT